MLNPLTTFLNARLAPSTGRDRIANLYLFYISILLRLVPTDFRASASRDYRAVEDIRRVYIVKKNK